LICPFSFFLAFIGHTHFILDVIFSSDLGMPPSILSFLGSLCLFGFLTAFSHFSLKFFSCPPVWGVILVGICFHERKIIQAQKKGSQGMYLFQKRERNNKDGLSSFQRQATMINKL
jgi:hypothetical protein